MGLVEYIRSSGMFCPFIRTKKTMLTIINDDVQYLLYDVIFIVTYDFLLAL